MIFCEALLNNGVFMKPKPTVPQKSYQALSRWGKRFFVMDRKRLIWFSLKHRGIKASKEIDRNRRERIARSSPSAER